MQIELKSTLGYLDREDRPQERRHSELSCLHHLFEAQVEITPAAVAVISASECLSYFELNRRANRLAHYLQTLGVGPEVLVGIMTERSVDMLVGILAILKAGGAYLPLDHRYPHERLSLMVSDAQISLLLTQSSLAHLLRDIEIRTVCVDADSATISQEEEISSCAATESNLAYVIYTSGSTGRPKGVMIEHRSAVALVQWARTVFSATELNGVLASTSICFDLSVFELFVPLAWGGRVIIVDDVLQLSNFHAAEEVTLINTVPSGIRGLLRLSGIPRSVRTVNLAGEPLSRSLVQDLYQHRQIARVLNLYGPSEDTTYSTFASIARESDRSPSIGVPISNTQVHILNADMETVPAGEVGELYISGEGLARGYLGWPGLTAEKFVPSPFSNEPGARLYKTGDLVRYLPDGEIEFLGRLDQQVKVRGYRIELGEIEATLSGHPQVRECVIVARGEETERQLIGYVVVSEISGKVEAAELRAYLSERLPEYMVPGVFVFLAELPLTPNGKVDRKALPAPEQLKAENRGRYVAPRTLLEETVANIWAEVLGVDQVGRSDDFFELGGHSLLAVRVLSRLREACGVDITLRAFFEHPMLAPFADYIDSAVVRKQGLIIPELKTVDRNLEVPFSYAQERLWRLDQALSGATVSNMQRALRISGSLDTSILNRSFSEVVRRHESLRTSFRSKGDHLFLNIAPASDFCLQLIDVSDLSLPEQETDTTRFINEEKTRPFDLFQGPLIRAVVIRFGNEDHLLLITVHHIIADATSMSILLNEVWQVYEAYSSGQSSPLPDLKFQYTDYVYWQRQWLQGEFLENQLNYWTHKLSGVPTLLELPTDRPRNAAASYRGARQDLFLSNALRERLLAVCERERVTLFVLMLAAFKALLFLWSGQKDIVIGSPEEGRATETQGLIGMFVGTLIIRTKLSPELSFVQLLKNTRETVLDAHQHRHIPILRLIERLPNLTDMGDMSLYQVIFNFQNSQSLVRKINGLTLAPHEIDTIMSRFDLTMGIMNNQKGLSASAIYRTSLFDASTISHLMKSFEALLTSIADNPQQTLTDVRLSVKRILRARDSENHETNQSPSCNSGFTYSEPNESSRHLSTHGIPRGGDTG